VRIHASQTRRGPTRVARSAVALTILLAGCGDGTNAPPGPPAPPDNYEEISQYSSDALVLAARIGTQPWLDLDLVAEIDDALTRARAAGPVFGYIEGLPDFVFDEMLAYARDPVYAKWASGAIYVGDPYLDSLAATYFLTRVDTLRLSHWVKLSFQYPLDIPHLAALYERSPDTFIAEANGYIGDSDRLWGFEKGGDWHIVFSHGEGDCPAGCIDRGYSYVEVPSAGAARVVEERPLVGATFPWLPRWNTPERYSVTLFGTADSLLSAYEHPDWWVRRHAIEATWRIVTRTSPGYGEDIGATWTEMKADLAERINEVAARLTARLSDPDSDVRDSASRALEYIDTGPPPR